MFTSAANPTNSLKSISSLLVISSLHAYSSSSSRSSSSSLSNSSYSSSLVSAKSTDLISTSDSGSPKTLIQVKGKFSLSINLISTSLMSLFRTYTLSNPIFSNAIIKTTTIWGNTALRQVSSQLWAVRGK